MINPICNTLFDSRDLIEYKEGLENDLLNFWNDLAETKGVNGMDEISDIFDSDGDFTKGAEADEVWGEFTTEYENDIEEYQKLMPFYNELKDYGDFEHGEVIIAENYFTEYTENLLEDCGYIPKDLPSWVVLDFEATAENLKVDYTYATYDGENYYIRM